MLDSFAILRLLQLASPALPVGAYSYSEGVESLVEVGVIKNQQSLEQWITQELKYGAIRLEAAISLRAYRAIVNDDFTALQHWNDWLSASRETEELRLQSLQMGRSLLRLFLDLHPNLTDLIPESLEHHCNFAIAFGLAAAYWQIDSTAMLLGYLQSWATNLINAGIKLIPLGQRAGQQLLIELQPSLIETVHTVMKLSDDALSSCNWGLTIASMKHETQYSRLFRS